MSRYALAACTAAVLSLFGLAHTDPDVTRLSIAPGTSASFSAPNSVHVQMMREASGIYGAKVREDRSAHRGAHGAIANDDSGDPSRCSRYGQAAEAAPGAGAISHEGEPRGRDCDKL